ncbi:MAG: hypothetical protein KF823_03165 [Xanthomonadales bacterium]|nr:hypothetical protein [Xanthomonadales bacterium]
MRMPVLTLSRAAVVALAVLAGPVAAEPAFELGVPQPDGSLAASLVAGTSQTLELRGVWRDGCVPRLAGVAGTGLRRTVHLEVADAGNRVCLQVLTPFRIDVPAVWFDESTVGVAEVVVVEVGANWLSRNSLAVQPAQGGDAVSAHPVAGGWSDPAVPGSGLFLFHDRGEERDQVWGYWLNFAPDGSSTWYLLTEARWLRADRLRGRLVAVEGAPWNCGFLPWPACQLPARPAVRMVGDVWGFQMTLSGPDRATVVFGPQDAAAGGPSITVELQRF